MTKISEVDNWPEFVVKMPQPDTLLSPEQFQKFLVHDITSLKSSEGRINWLFVLAYSVSSLDIKPSLKSIIAFTYIILYQQKSTH